MTVPNFKLDCYLDYVLAPVEKPQVSTEGLRPIAAAFEANIQRLLGVMNFPLRRWV
jgi:hypothetical protein